MHVRVQVRKAQAWARVRKAVRAFRFEQVHACWCCGHESVNRAEERVWEARRAARAVR
jgi:ribosomal protein L37AE/L43A